MARSAVDVERESGMTVNFSNTTKNGAAEQISNAEFRIYRIADIDRESDYHWSGDFIGREEDFRELTEESWKELAETLWQEVRAVPEIEPLETQFTGGDGCFSLTGLRTGLYLVAGPETGNHRAEGLEHEYYTPVPGIVSLPDLISDGPDEVWQYSPTVYPKLTYRDPEPGPDTDLLLQKKWVGGSPRPAVTIRLLRDDDVCGEYTITEAEGWQCRVSLSGEEYAAHEWSISELAVSGYRRSYSRDGKTFTVTNTRSGGGGSGGGGGPTGKTDFGKKEEPPTETTAETTVGETTGEDETDDTLPRTGLLWWPVPVLTAAGIALIMLGTWLRSQDQ